MLEVTRQGIGRSDNSFLFPDENTYFMDNLSHFHSLEELIRALDRERKLLHALFQDRKKLSFRYDLARELASKKDESIEFLRRYGVIREHADFVELEDVYLKFFEDVLEVNEEINVASVKESIGNLNNAIDYYLSENNPSRKYGSYNRGRARGCHPEI